MANTGTTNQIVVLGFRATRDDQTVMDQKKRFAAADLATRSARKGVDMLADQLELSDPATRRLRDAADELRPITVPDGAARVELTVSREEAPSEQQIDYGLALYVEHMRLGDDDEIEQARKKLANHTKRELSDVISQMKQAGTSTQHDRDQAAKAEREGRCWWTKTQGGVWAIEGPARTVRTGATVTVQGKEGRTSRQRIAEAGKTWQRDGVTWVYGYTETRTERNRATSKQVDMIVRLIREGRWHDSDAGQGFHPPTVAQVKKMTKSEASALISDLKES